MAFTTSNTHLGREGNVARVDAFQEMGDLGTSVIGSPQLSTSNRRAQPTTHSSAKGHDDVFKVAKSAGCGQAGLNGRLLRPVRKSGIGGEVLPSSERPRHPLDHQGRSLTNSSVK